MQDSFRCLLWWEFTVGPEVLPTTVVHGQLVIRLCVTALITNVHIASVPTQHVEQRSPKWHSKIPFTFRTQRCVLHVAVRGCHTPEQHWQYSEHDGQTATFQLEETHRHDEYFVGQLTSNRTMKRMTWSADLDAQTQHRRVGNTREGFRKLGLTTESVCTSKSGDLQTMSPRMKCHFW